MAKDDVRSKAVVLLLLIHCLLLFPLFLLFCVFLFGLFFIIIFWGVGGGLCVWSMLCYSLLYVLLVFSCVMFPVFCHFPIKVS